MSFSRAPQLFVRLLLVLFVFRFTGGEFPLGIPELLFAGQNFRLGVIQFVLCGGKFGFRLFFAVGEFLFTGQQKIFLLLSKRRFFLVVLERRRVGRFSAFQLRLKLCRLFGQPGFQKSGDVASSLSSSLLELSSCCL